MSSFHSRLGAVLASVAVAATFVPGTVLAACPAAFEQVNADGFGNRFNLYAWSMQVFNDRLLVGTMNESTGGEIWSYDGNAWTRVLQQDAQQTGNTGFRSMILFRGFLYAGGTNDTHGAELWRSIDGVRWRKVVSGGFGSADNHSIRGVAVFRNRLYIGLQNASGTGGQLWRSSDGVNFEPVSIDGFGDPTNVSMHSMAVFGDKLYVGTKNKDTLIQLWRSGNGTRWEQVVGPSARVPSGFGVEGNILTQSMFVYDGMLYIGSGNALDNGDPLNGFTVVRSADGTSFQPITVTGAGDVDNRFAWRFFNFQNQLYLGVGNFNILGGEGGQLWRSATGAPGAWEALVGPNGPYGSYGFGDPMNWGIRSFAEYRGELYVGTAQCWQKWCSPSITGAEIWRWSGDQCPAGASAKRGAPMR